MEKKTQKRMRLSQFVSEDVDDCDIADVYTLKRLEASMTKMDIGVVAHHIISVKDSLAQAQIGNGQPILFRVITDGDSDSYAWWPLRQDESVKVLNALYATLVYDAHSAQQKQEHRTLVDSMTKLLSGQVEEMQQRNQAKALLVSYFGTHELGSMKKVYFHGQGTRAMGEIDFYHLPVKMATYTWLGI